MGAGGQAASIVIERRAVPKVEEASRRAADPELDALLKPKKKRRRSFGSRAPGLGPGPRPRARGPGPGIGRRQGVVGRQGRARKVGL